MTRSIAFLAYEGFELLDISGPTSVFAEANHAAGAEGESPYEITIVSAIGGLVTSGRGVALQSSKLTEVPPATVNTLLVPGAYEHSLVAAISEPANRIWVSECAGAAERFGSVCSGTFILAAFGLIEGRRVTTHWDGAALLSEMYPGIIVEADRLYVCDGNLWTSAGVTTGIDMALAIVAEDLGTAVASLVARRLVLYSRRPGYQSQFSPLLRAQVKADNPFGELMSWIQENLNLPLDVRHLAERVGMSERSFYRKFAAATGQPPAHFVEAARLDAARTLFSQQLPIKTVAALVGYGRPSRLAAAFERRFGMSPKLFKDIHASRDRG